MARAIGLEIKKCLVWKSEQEAAVKQSADAAAADEHQLIDR